MEPSAGKEREADVPLPSRVLRWMMKMTKMMGHLTESPKGHRHFFFVMTERERREVSLQDNRREIRRLWIRKLLPPVIFRFSSTRLTAAAKEANCFAVCKLSFCSSRQRKTFYTTSQVLCALLIFITLPFSSLLHILRRDAAKNVA